MEIPSMPRKLKFDGSLETLLQENPKTIADEMRVFSAQMLQNIGKTNSDGGSHAMLMIQQLKEEYDRLDNKAKVKAQKKIVAVCLRCLETNDWNSAHILSSLLGYDTYPTFKPYAEKEPKIGLLLAPFTGPGGNRKLFTYFKNEFDNTPGMIPSTLVIRNILGTNAETEGNCNNQLDDLANDKLNTEGEKPEVIFENILFILGKLAHDNDGIDYLVKKIRAALNESEYPDSLLFKQLAASLDEQFEYNTNTRPNLTENTLFTEPKLIENASDKEVDEQENDSDNEAVKEENLLLSHFLKQTKLLLIKRLVDKFDPNQPIDEQTNANGQEQQAREKSSDKKSIAKMKKYFSAYREARADEVFRTQSPPSSPQPERHEAPTKKTSSPVAVRLKKSSIDWRTKSRFDQLIKIFKSNLVDCFKEKHDPKIFSEKLAKLENTYNAIVQYVDTLKEKNTNIDPQIQYQLHTITAKIKAVRLLDEHNKIVDDIQRSPPPRT